MLVALVLDKPGVLNRVSSLMRARNFNIESLAVSHTDQPDISRMTITLHGDDVAVEQAAKQLYRLIDVLKVQDLTNEPTVEHELALVKVRATDAQPGRDRQIVELYKGRVVDLAEARSSSRRPARRPRSTRWSRSVAGLRDQGIGSDRDRGDGPAAPASIEEATQAMTATHVLRQRRGPVRAGRADRGDHRLRQQGHAHALNLHESGVDVIVGLAPGTKSRPLAEDAGLRVADVAEAVKAADVVMILVPDTAQKAVYDEEIVPNLRPGQLLLFAHGFNIHFRRIDPPAGVDVGMVAPEGPGPPRPQRLPGGRRRAGAVRRRTATRAAPPAPATLAYARGLGTTRAGVLETTFAEETETDLFGEQSVLCGGTAALVKMAFETLVEAGYQPELAYFETMHELKLIVDLMYRGGLNFMRFSVSDTAEFGDYVSGPRIIDDHVRVDDEGRPRATSRTARSPSAGSRRTSAAGRTSSACAQPTGTT